jgi:hypothetical protein
LLAEAFDFHSEEEDGAGGLGARDKPALEAADLDAADLEGLVDAFFDGQAAAADVQRRLTKRLLAAASDKEEVEKIKLTMEAISAAAACAGQQQRAKASVPKAGGPSGVPGTTGRQGPMVTLWGSLVKRAAHDMYERSGSMDKVFMHGGQLVAEHTPDGYLVDAVVFLRTLLQLHHCLVAQGELTEQEAYKLHSFMVDLVFAKQPVAPVERTLRLVLADLDRGDAVADVLPNAMMMFQQQHMQWVSRTGGAALPLGGGGGGSGGDRLCHKCGQKGHIRANCPSSKGGGQRVQGAAGASIKFTAGQDWCWAWTNGNACKQLDGNGKCTHKHVCKARKPDGSICEESSHRACDRICH